MKKPFVTVQQLEDIAALYPTPFHLYDEQGIRENACDPPDILQQCYCS